MDQLLIALKFIAKLKLTDPKTDKAQLLAVISSGQSFSDYSLFVAFAQTNQETMNCIKWTHSVIAASLKLTSEQMIPLDEFLVIYAQLRSLVIRIEGWGFDVIGAGIYLRGTTIQHGYAPNACAWYSGKTLIISAMENIDSLADVRMSYVDQLEPVETRQEKLQRHYSITCTCEMCADTKQDAERFSLCCVNPSCEARIPMDNRASLPCVKCQSKAQKDRLEVVQTALQEMSYGIDQWANVDPLSPRSKKSMADIEKKLTKLLHPTNPLWCEFFCRKGHFLRKLNDKSAAARSFAKAMGLYRPWLSPRDPRLGMCAFSAIDHGADDVKDQLEKLHEVQCVLGLVYGKDHPVVVLSKMACGVFGTADGFFGSMSIKAHCDEFDRLLAELKDSGRYVADLDLELQSAEISAARVEEDGEEEWFSCEED